MKNKTLTRLLLLAGIAAVAAPALAQSDTSEPWLRGNALATRERAYTEVRQARVDGTIKPFWGTPLLIELPLQARPQSAAPGAVSDEPPSLLRAAPREPTRGSMVLAAF